MKKSENSLINNQNKDKYNDYFVLNTKNGEAKSFPLPLIGPNRPYLTLPPLLLALTPQPVLLTLHAQIFLYQQLGFKLTSQHL